MDVDVGLRDARDVFKGRKGQKGRKGHEQAQPQPRFPAGITRGGQPGMLRATRSVSPKVALSFQGGASGALFRAGNLWTFRATRSVCTGKNASATVAPAYKHSATVVSFNGI